MTRKGGRPETASDDNEDADLFSHKLDSAARTQRAIGFSAEAGDLFPALVRRDEKDNRDRDRDRDRNRDRGRGRGRGSDRDRNRDWDRDRSMSPERMNSTSSRVGRWNRDGGPLSGGQRNDSYNHPGRLREDSRKTTTAPRGRNWPRTSDRDRNGDQDAEGEDGAKWIKGDKLEDIQFKERLESGADDLRSRFDPRPSGERKRTSNRRRAQDHF